MMYYLYAAALGFLIFIVVIQIKKNATRKSMYAQRLQEALDYLQKISKAKEDYIIQPFPKKINGQYHETYRFFRGDRTVKKDIQLQNFIDIYAHLDEYRKQWNQEYVRNELLKNKEFFDDISGKSLDEQQRIAIITDEINNLILAGAGSGKTLTIEGKTKYLVEKKGVDPQKILLISFTRKSANEMEERITQNHKIGIEAMTFHKLGLQIISRAGMRPDVLDNMDSFLADYFRKTIYQDNAQLMHLINFFSIYLHVPDDLEKYSSLGEYYNVQKNMKFETLKDKLELDKFLESKELELKYDKKTIKGDQVKSLEEVIIANFLFLHAIEYKYEEPYPFDSDDKFRKRYHPDFYLPKYDIYIEHFGITKGERTPWLTPIEENKYISDMQWKREFHKKNNTMLVETYSHYNSDGILVDKLKEKLLEKGVVLGSVDTKEIYDKLVANDDRCFTDFIDLVSTFLCLFKSKNYDFSGFEKIKKESVSKIPNPFMRNRAFVFLDVVKPIYVKYQEYLAQNQSIDFNDMINNAVTIVKERGFFKSLSHIIIDEYQDISFSRFSLVQAIQEATDAKVMCVGDDWQSIYRFAGSDISLFTQFQRYLGFTETMKIEKTYRNSQELIDIAGSFVMRNEQQLKKQLISNKHLSNPVRIFYYDSLLEKLTDVLDEIARTQGESSSIMLIGRNNADIEYAFGKLLADNDSDKQQYIKLKKTKEDTTVLYQKHPKLKIHFLTAHRSKGLEADNVILINGKNDTYGFPNRIADDPLISLVLANEDSYEFSEERRLFYVAITRTRNLTYILAPMSDPSIFVTELIEKNIVVPINAMDNPLLKKPPCPRCKLGRLIVREALVTKKKFLGCSNFPRCDFSLNQIEVMDNQVRCAKCSGYMVKRSSARGDFYGCSNYPLCTNTINLESKDQVVSSS